MKHDKSGRSGESGNKGGAPKGSWRGNGGGYNRVSPKKSAPQGRSDSMPKDPPAEWSPTAASRSFPTARDTVCRELLSRGLEAIGLGAAAYPRLAAGLDSYIKEIELWNPRMGLVEAGGAELITKHVLDSLAPWTLFRARLAGSGKTHIADLGSGGGFPAIPLALALRDTDLDWSMDLYERQERRAVFLGNCIALLGLKDRVRVCQTLLAGMDKPTVDGKPDFTRRAAGAPVPQQYDLVTARAFRPLDAVVLPAMINMLSPRGQLFLYKGRLSGIREELDRAGSDALVVPVAVPGLDEERHVVMVTNNTQEGKTGL